jgi:hypothetical protein
MVIIIIPVRRSPHGRLTSASSCRTRAGVLRTPDSTPTTIQRGDGCQPNDSLFAASKPSIVSAKRDILVACSAFPELFSSEMDSDWKSRSLVSATLLQPSKWLTLYEDFVTKNASSVGQVESALRSLTYIIPGEDCAEAPPSAFSSTADGS